MKKKYKNHNIFLLVMALIACFLLLASPFPVSAQESGVIQTLTRGRLWYSSYEAYQLATGTYQSAMAYPGYFNVSDTHPNNILGANNSLNNYVATRNGRVRRGQTNWKQYLISFKGVVENTLVKNYNFSLSLEEAEEYSYGAVQATPDVPMGVEYHHPELIFKEKRMVWSLPKYDDFVIIRTVVINAEDSTLTDVYIGHEHTITLTPGGQSVEFTNDDEFEWDPTIRTITDEQGAFIFYDDTEIPISDPDHEVEYFISPGNITGDRGDPGNIRDANSIDYQLYSPQVFAVNIVNCTPNKNGEKKVYQEIVTKNSNADRTQQYIWEDWTDVYWKDRLAQDQVRMSWREARDDPSTLDGNIYEREPVFEVNIGPYDLAPGDSIEYIKILVCGEMDRSISMAGGLDATQNYKSAGIANLKENWEAALELIEGWEASGRTNWNAGINAYPPPTPANVPMIGNDNELEATIFVDAETRAQGFDIAWKPIPESYVDPLKGTNDLAGYKVYKSEIGIAGPWEEVTDLTRAEAQELIKDGKIVYRYTARVGIPMRFCVTSYDTDGNESGKTGYTFDAEAAPPAPSNKFEDVRVVPNPFKQVSGLAEPGEMKRLIFMNIPAQCTIKIFTMAGELVQTIEHDGFGLEAWGSVTENNYMLTRFAQNVMPGIYIYHIESHVPGHEGESAVGKFAILK